MIKFKLMRSSNISSSSFIHKCILLVTASIMFLVSLSLMTLTIPATASPSNDNCTPIHSLHFNMNVESNDPYEAWVRVKAHSNTNLSISTASQCAHLQLKQSDDWVWMRFDTPLVLQQGSRSADIYTSAHEVEVDKMLFMTDSDCVPEGRDGDNCVLDAISITLDGIEQEVVTGSDLRISAEVQGAVKPVVTFMLDGSLLPNGSPLKEGELYCATNVDGDICGTLPAALLGVGPHKLSVVVTDAGRRVSTSKEFTVTLGDTTLVKRPTGSGVSSDGSKLGGKEAASAAIYRSVPTFVLGQGSVLSETVSGKIQLTVPSSLTPKGNEAIQYFVDDVQIGTSIAATPLIFDTASLENHGHQFKASIDNGAGINRVVEVTAVINNSPLNSIKNWLAQPKIRFSIAAGCAIIALFVGFIVLRVHARAQRLKAVTKVNTQHLSYVAPSGLSARGYGVLVVLTLLTLGIALIAAPATPAYDGNASTVVELEDARTNYDHETGFDEVTSTTYVILR